MPKTTVSHLNELYFVCEMQEMCKTAFSGIMEKMDVSGTPEVLVLPDGGIRIFAMAKDMNINAFWDEDTQVMKVFIPDLAEQLEKVRQIREICSMAGSLKNLSFSFSGISLSDLPVMNDMLVDYCKFTGKNPVLPADDWHSSVNFGMEMTYDRKTEKGTPFKVFSSCSLLCGREVMNSLKKLMAFGMDKKTAVGLKEEFDRLIIPAKSYLVGGDVPQSMEEFEQNMLAGLASTWLVTDIRQDAEEKQMESSKMGM